MKKLKRKPFFVIIIILLSIVAFVFSLLTENKQLKLYALILIFANNIVFALIYVHNYGRNRHLSFLENRMRLWNSISYRVKNAGESAFNNLPIGIVVFNKEYNIDWANNYSKDIFMSPLVGRNIKNLDETLSQKLSNQENTFQVTLYGIIYECRYLVNEGVLYLSDINEQMKIKEKYADRMLAIGILNFDNLTVAFAPLDAQERSFQISNLIKILNEWTDKNHISLTGYSEERYLLIMDRAGLQKITSENFEVLDSIKNYAQKESLRITASLGIACHDVDAITLFDEASAQLELALNRGGNQAIVALDGEVHYYGATTEAFEARSSINVRIKMEELRDLIQSSSSAMIMSHMDMDADAFGASVAVAKLLKAFGREPQIVFDVKLVDQTVVNIYETILKEHVNFLHYLVTPKEALGKMTDDTLVIVVDCQYQNLLMDEKIYKRCKKLAIIDHHRRGTQAISNYNYIYSQPSSSSSVELIVEMYQYVQEQIDVSAIEATWMLMGIIIDTNNLVYRTTSRTFSVLAQLQGYGANMSLVQKYLREEFGDFVKRISILNNIETINGLYGIALCDDDIYPRSFLAKIANEIILVKDIKVAFCIGRISEDTIGISARSLEDANVQVIMEKMGGGGHFSNAAAQIKNGTISSVREMLINILNEKDNEGGKFMKIILTKDVKGKGKARDIIEIPAGHANFLIRSKQAIEATPDNIKHLEYEKNLEKQAQEKNLRDMQELKGRVESSPITIQVKVGSSGKLFGSVSSKQIADELQRQYNISIDKRKMLFDKDIDTLGTHKILIQLHKEVMATITVHVIEKE